jgi:hypothetical protein
VELIPDPPEGYLKDLNGELVYPKFDCGDLLVGGMTYTAATAAAAA